MNSLPEVIKEVSNKMAGYQVLELPKGKIRTNKDQKLASDATKFINDRIKFAEAKRKEITQPYLDGKRKIDAAFKELISPLEKIAEDVKVKMTEFAIFKAEEQKAYEEKKMLENPTETNLIVDDKVAKSKQGEVSSNYLKTTIKYRAKNPALRDIIEIKSEALKAYLTKGFDMPEFIESYIEKNIVIRTK